ncbi:MAG TPA: LysM peptidoglycan-binding domain-containing protein [Longimicrobium sp.]|nr:LysM peptidoglycan-binding domain-containing protein [Longimicrobium sp.]
MPRTPTHASRLSLVLLLAALAACAGPPRPEQPAPAPEPPPLPELPAPEPDGLGEGFAIDGDTRPARTAAAALLGGASYDLPVEANRWVEMELDFLVNQRHAVIGRWLERADRYDEWVRDVFAGYGLPRDLHHLAMVESGYQATVRSHAGAVGMWQFMPATGRGMGLRIDDTVDERMDPVRSTHAAARHLAQLHRAFRGDWPLAVAAYNAGAGRISRGLGRYGVTNFWDLSERGDLAQETRHYVPRLYAVAIIAKDPQRFGYPAPSGVVRRFQYDSVRVDVPTPLTELAKLGNYPVGELVSLNPHLYRGVAPANYWVWAPHGSGAALQTAYDGSDFRRRGGLAFYTLRRGESLASIVEASGLTPDQVRSYNLSTNVDRLGRGERVRLPADAVRLLSARPAERLASRDESGERDEARRASSSRATGTRASRRSSSSSSSSSSSESSSDDSSERRGTRAAARDASDDSSRRPGEGEARRRSSSEEGESSTRRSSSSSSSSSSSRSTRAAEGRKHTVEGGETLWGLARRYDVTVAQVREANGLDEDDAIQPGQELRIPRAPASSASSRTASAAREREGGEGRRPSSSSSSSTASSSTTRRASRTAEHVVKSGDTLWSLARTYDSSVEAIRDANGMDEGDAIQPGQKLRIPRNTSSGGQR